MYFVSLSMQKSEPVPLMFTLHHDYVHNDVLASSRRMPERHSWYSWPQVISLDARSNVNHVLLGLAFLKRMKMS